MSYHLLKEEEGIRKVLETQVISSEQAQSLHPLKLRILKMLSATPSYVSEIAHAFGIKEQLVYYHLKDIMPLLEVVEERKVRGTVARKFKTKAQAVTILFSSTYQQFESVAQHPSFFNPFIKGGIFSGIVVVGSPDPHGPFKARSRDGHYAIDLALYLGSLGKLPDHFTVSLDVDLKLQDAKSNLVVVGGPVTNLISGMLQESLPVRFVSDEHWALIGKAKVYHDDNVGLIARLPHPYNPDATVLVLAGIRFSGTKAAVIGLTRKASLVLNHFTGQKKFYAIVQGFDLDGDGKIDSIELLESG